MMWPAPLLSSKPRFGETGWRDRAAAAAEANIRRWNALAAGDRRRVGAVCGLRQGVNAGLIQAGVWSGPLAADRVRLLF